MAISIISTYNSATSEETDHIITMPSTITRGNLLIAFFTCDGNGVSIGINRDYSGQDWQELYEYSSTGNSAAIYWKIAEGSDWDYLMLTTDSAETSTAIVYNIYGASKFNPTYEYSEGGGSNADPASLIPLYGLYEYLFIVYAGIEGTVIASAAPTNFTGLITEQSDASGASSSSAYRLYTTNSSYDPGAFTSSSAYYVTFTVCIAPLEAGGIGLSNIGIQNLNM